MPELENPNWNNILGEKRDKSIDAFVNAHPEAEFSSINIGGKIIFLIQARDVAIITASDSPLIEAILKKQDRVEADGILNECFLIAVESVDDGTSDGVLFSLSLEGGNFLGFANHAVNYKRLDDGSIVAVDFTSPQNLDQDRGTYRTLCFHGKDIEVIKRYLSDLYGGVWEEAGESDLENIRKISYRAKRVADMGKVIKH